MVFISPIVVSSSDWASSGKLLYIVVFLNYGCFSLFHEVILPECCTSCFWPLYLEIPTNWYCTILFLLFKYFSSPSFYATWQTETISLHGFNLWVNLFQKQFLHGRTWAWKLVSFPHTAVATQHCKKSSLTWQTLIRFLKSRKSVLSILPTHAHSSASKDALILNKKLCCARVRLHQSQIMAQWLLQTMQAKFHSNSLTNLWDKLGADNAATLTSAQANFGFLQEMELYLLLKAADTILSHSPQWHNCLWNRYAHPRQGYTNYRHHWRKRATAEQMQFAVRGCMTFPLGTRWRWKDCGICTD